MESLIRTLRWTDPPANSDSSGNWLSLSWLNEFVLLGYNLPSLRRLITHPSVLVVEVGTSQFIASAIAFGAILRAAEDRFAEDPGGGGVTAREGMRVRLSGVTYGILTRK